MPSACSRHHAPILKSHVEDVSGPASFQGKIDAYQSGFSLAHIELHPGLKMGLLAPPNEEPMSLKTDLGCGMSYKEQVPHLFFLDRTEDRSGGLMYYIPETMSLFTLQRKRRKGKREQLPLKEKKETGYHQNYLSEGGKEQLMGIPLLEGST